MAVVISFSQLTGIIEPKSDQQATYATSATNRIMNTAEKFHSPYLPSSTAIEPRPSRSQATGAWAKLQKVIRGLLGMGRAGAVQENATAPAGQCGLPIVSKVATISAAGISRATARQLARSIARPPVPPRAITPANDRRPGLQNRWKSSDRVAIL
jgi:hypothetical protein